MSNRNNDRLEKVFGDKIKLLREKKGWKQDVLAAEASLSQSEISKIENGTIRVADETILKLAEALEVGVEFLARNTVYASSFGNFPLANVGNTNQNQPITAYFASALTGLRDAERNEVTELDERVSLICKGYSRYSIALYRPRLKTSPTENPEVSSRDVYDIDQERVASSDLIFLAAIFPSLGAGMELQLALQSCKSIILIKKKDVNLSRMVLGCPAVIQTVEYKELSDLNTGLVKAMDSLLPAVAELGLRNPQLDDSFALGNRIKQLRLQRNYKEDQLARQIGVDANYIESLESKSEHIVNPSLEIIRRIAKALLTSESYLISGQHINSVFIDHFDGVRDYAKKFNLSFAEGDELWSFHTETYGKDFSMIGVSNRAEVGDEKYWKDLQKYLKEQKEKGGRLF